MQQPIVTKDEANKTITIERMFSAPRAKVWQAWTTRELLEPWWAPKPWKAVTKSFDFSEGGRWLYYMEGPDGTKSWSLIDYLTIDPEHGFTAKDAFCDEEGNLNPDMPATDWNIQFSEQDGQTKIMVKLVFASLESMKQIIEMGFEEGFSMGLNQLEELLSA